MNPPKKFPYFFLLTLLLSLGLFLWETFPLLSGYGAKVCCSGVFISHRDPDSVIANDLGRFPFNLANYQVDGKDSSVRATVWGMAVKKAIYHTGLGAVLVNGTTEAALRQSWRNIQTAVPPKDTLPLDNGDTAALAGMIKKEVGRNGTRGLIVLYKDKVIGEGYAPGFDQNTPLAGWSMTKGIVSALLGILVREKRLDVRAPAPVAAWKDDNRRTIRTIDLMQMRSGLRWWEWYIGPCPCTDMLFKERDMGEAAARSSLRHPSGTVFNYSSGNANILSSIIRGCVDSNDYYRWPYEQLFYKIGMIHTVLEPDAGGTFVGSSYCYATARDWARLGLLYLHDGVWNGQRILPEGWVHEATTGAGIYGALWWLNGGRWPHVPTDAYAAEGYEGQYVLVVPSRDLVVVRLALDRGKPHPDSLMHEVLQALH
ncbi:serine hydrolase domain-containing protein [Dinghuibacter silviterrae]|uniref:Beta-lactamase-related domain-containing protein n=1 Tax=Dinghuibacter silviterrae TaxID=1539049 RepID=A0A4R8DHJ5_9BACT|nr:serine hydrolase [Dinghuibacter silviterrae]TDW96714.1 hypothetical protein EDB95_4550 [Dinghuibacter silviterrae]